jgi:hypothetical protein
MRIRKSFYGRRQQFAPHLVKLSMRLLEKETELDNWLVVFQPPLNRRDSVIAYLPGGIENPFGGLCADWVAAIQNAIDR